MKIGDIIHGYTKFFVIIDRKYNIYVAKELNQNRQNWTINLSRIQKNDVFYTDIFREPKEPKRKHRRKRT